MKVAPLPEVVAALEAIRPRFAGVPTVVIAPGPSAEKLWDDRQTSLPKIAVSDAWKLIPDAEILHSSDRKWWSHYKSVPEFSGLKTGCVIFGAGLPPGVLRLTVSGENGFDPRLGCLRTGRNSGFAAVHLAMQLGANPILLIGFDMRRVEGRAHFFGEHPRPLARAAPYPQFAPVFESLCHPAAAKGIRIVNCTPGSKVKAFPFGELDLELERLVAAA